MKQKLTKRNIERILAKRKNKLPLRTIAKDMGVSLGTIQYWLMPAQKRRARNQDSAKRQREKK